MVSSCVKLDSNLYSPVALKEYKLDNYDGYQELDELSTLYTIPSDKIHEVELVSGGNKIFGYYLGDINTIAQDTVLLYCHGTAGNIDTYWNRCKLLANIGGKNRYGVFAIDYRGYGKSQGKPSEKGMYEDVDAATLWLKDKGLTSNRLIQYGYSLGSAPATELTALPRSLTPSKLILEAPFASTQVMTQDAALLNLESDFFTSQKVDNATKIPSVNQPFMWLHCKTDDYLNIETHGEVLFARYKGIQGVPVRVEGGKHNNLPQQMGYTTYLQTLYNFIK